MWWSNYLILYNSIVTQDDESDRASVRSAMRKTKSIDASILDMRSLGDVVNSAVVHMPRAKSEYNLISAAPSEGEIRHINIYYSWQIIIKTLFLAA